uniref:C2H2-type domain-containing protein n=1 Tax=Salvator merianae TaxID=96440 RepID=A0A8D0C9R0_SALMN
MEAQRPPCPPVSLDDQPAQLSCLQAIPVASNLSLSPVILQPEQASPQTIYLKAFTIPLYQPIQSECHWSNNKLSTDQTGTSLDSSNVPLIISPLFNTEGKDQLQAIIPRQPGTINIISGLPILPQNSSPCAPIGSPGKSRSAGKYLCKHCGRDCLKPSVLEKHMRSHTGERPFPCTTCGIAFKTQSNLYKHRRTQTHVNNSRLPSESNSSNALEDNEKRTESVTSFQTTKASNRNCDHPRTPVKQAISGCAANINSKTCTSDTLATVTSPSLVSESQAVTTDSCHGGSSQSVFEKDPAAQSQRRKIQEQRSPTFSKHSQLQRQQATYPERLWDSRSPDYKLKKCESTDSGYLSHSNSVEQPLLSPSPLHSLCEQSTESEGDTDMSDHRGVSGSSTKADLNEKALGALTLEKKKLEEHISKLISHNKAVVCDTQLDNVRPRKTVLSKQGSIDLPMPYTYKDSFHFDIRPADINRKKHLSLYSTKSIFTLVEKSKPLFFHSVPTQFSTTIDCVPVTRSNSVPFVESSRRIQAKMDNSKLPSFTGTSPNTSFSSLLHSNSVARSTAESPPSHPRPLVRQVAVEDLSLSKMAESSSLSLEEMKGIKKSSAGGGQGATTKNKKPTQRKLKMFSQEKWQVYGDETFKKIYQKMKSSRESKKQKGSKMSEISGLHLDTKEVTRLERSSLPREGRSFTIQDCVSSQVPVSAKLNTEELEGCSLDCSISQCASSQESPGNFAKSMEISCSSSNCEPGGLTKTLLEQRDKDLVISKPDSSGNNWVQSVGQEAGSSLNASSPLGRETEEDDFTECVSVLHEGISSSKEDDTRMKESLQFAQETLPLHQCNSEESAQGFQKMPSERKKLKVDKQKSSDPAELKANLVSSSSTETTVIFLDQYRLTDLVAPVSVSHPDKEKKQIVTPRANTPGTSMECKDAAQWLRMTSGDHKDVGYHTDTKSIASLSFSEQLRAQITKEYICNSCTIQKLPKDSCPAIAEAELFCQSGDMASTPTQHLVFEQVTPHIKRNDFLPKYILKHPQEETSTGLSLILSGDSKNKPCISLPCTSASSFCPESAKQSLGISSADVFLCPLKLELSHTARTNELKWDVHKTLKSQVVCSPTLLETTSITAMVDRRCNLQSAKQKEIMKNEWGEASDQDHLDDQKSAQNWDGHTIVCTPHMPGKKICFTSKYTGGFFITSDTTGQSSALQLVHSGNSSVLSVSSLVERAVLCENTDKKIREWHSDVNAVSGFQGLPLCSMTNSRCHCRSSDMFYCHVLCTQQKDVCTLSQLNIVSPSGKSEAPNLNLSFPTLNAEPQLTWCCLPRNLPLPVEQKGKKDSVYSSLHTCKNEKIVSESSLLFCTIKSTRKTALEALTTPATEKVTSLFPSCQIE